MNRMLNYGEPVGRQAVVNKAQRSANGLEILDKANAVLTYLETAGEAAVAEIAEAVDEPGSSTYRLVGSLHQLGWLDRAPQRGKYRLGLLLLHVASEVEDRLSLRDASAQALRELRNHTGQTTFLCVRRGTQAVCIDRVDGRSVRSLALELGASLPLHRGAAPLALLAYLPEAERQAVIAELGQTNPINLQDLTRQLGNVRRRGYTISNADVTAGIGAIGAPVLNHRGELVASVSVSGLLDAIIDDAQVAQKVVQTARGISRAMGWQEDMA